MARALLFAGTGGAFLVHWVVTAPATMTVGEMQQWPNVIAFSAVLATLALTLASFGRMVGGVQARRVAALAGTFVGAASVVNMLEDGLRIEAMFIVFVVCLLASEVTLLSLAVVVARSAAGTVRLLALVPALTAVSILIYPAFGGPLMAATWLGAAAAAAERGRRRISPTVPTGA